MSNKISVLLLIYDFQVESTGGGITRFAMELGKCLNPDLFEVRLCGLGYAGSQLEDRNIDELNRHGIQAFTASESIKDTPYKGFMGVVSFLNRYIHENPVHILHSHSEFGDIAALYLKFSQQVPKILRSVHYGYRYEWRKRPLRRFLLTNLLFPLYFSTEIGISPEIVRVLNQRPVARLLGKKAVYINNAINLHRFSNGSPNKLRVRKEKGLPEHGNIIGTVGRLTEQKGYCYLVEAAALVIKKMPNTHIFIIGDGELRPALAEQIHRENIENQVSLLGPRYDVDELLYGFDLFVSSSLWEGLPTVIMESMAAGIPVVATNIPGSNDLIEEGYSGWLAKPAHGQDLANKILEAISSPQQRAEYAGRASQSIQQYSIKIVAERHADLYLKIINR